MARGYEDVPHATYEEWKNNTIGKAYNLDDAYGCQCWDYASLFWRNVGFSAGYPMTGPNHAAYEVWTYSRNSNTGDQFELIYNKAEILTGDIIVMDANSFSEVGHITFANEDYNGTDTLSCLGQNQGGIPQPEGGENVSINNLDLGDFLGAFRYKKWHTPTPTSLSKKHFKWVLYARKLNQQRIK